MSQSNFPEAVPHIRQYTVSSCSQTRMVAKPFYVSKPCPVPVPYIRISGLWLKEAGFPIGGKFKATVNDGLLILEAVKK